MLIQVIFKKHLNKGHGKLYLESEAQLQCSHVAKFLKALYT